MYLQGKQNKTISRCQEHRAKHAANWLLVYTRWTSPLVLSHPTLFQSKIGPGLSCKITRTFDIINLLTIDMMYIKFIYVMFCPNILKYISYNPFVWTHKSAKWSRPFISWRLSHFHWCSTVRWSPPSWLMATTIGSMSLSVLHLEILRKWMKTSLRFIVKKKKCIESFQRTKVYLTKPGRKGHKLFSTCHVLIKQLHLYWIYMDKVMFVYLIWCF